MTTTEIVRANDVLPDTSLATRKPVVIAGAVQGLILAVLIALPVFGIEIDGGQVSAVLGVYAAVVALIFAVLYGKVTPYAVVDELVNGEGHIGIMDIPNIAPIDPADLEPFENPEEH